MAENMSNWLNNSNVEKSHTMGQPGLLNIRSFVSPSIDDHLRMHSQNICYCDFITDTVLLEIIYHAYLSFSWVQYVKFWTPYVDPGENYGWFSDKKSYYDKKFKMTAKSRVSRYIFQKKKTIS